MNALERGHGAVELLHLVQQVVEPEPALGLAGDDAPAQGFRLRFEPHQQVVVGAERGEHVRQVRVGLDHLGHDQEGRAGPRMRLAPGAQVLAAAREVREREGPRELIHVAAGVRDLVPGQRIA